jgi:FdhD protein
MSSEQYEAFRHDQHGFSHVKDNLVIEVPLEIHINSSSFTATMHSPGMELELVRGLLHSEDIYRSENDPEIAILESDEQGFIRKMNVTIPTEALGKGYLNGRSLLSVSSCGICGKKELSFPEEKMLKDDFHSDARSIREMFAEMSQNQHAYSITGGSHAAAIFNANKQLIAISEDIGRHNAVDKAVGSCLNRKILAESRYLLVSSRVSFEIVAKCFTAGIPILAAVSAPSSLAVDFCKELGITLLGFCRDDRFTIYSHPERMMRL